MKGEGIRWRLFMLGFWYPTVSATLWIPVFAGMTGARENENDKGNGCGNDGAGIAQPP